MADKLPLLANGTFEAQVHQLPGGMNMFTGETFIACIEHVLEERPKRAVNASLQDIIHVAGYLRTNTLLYDVLDNQLCDANLPYIYGMCYSIYGVDHAANKYIFEKLYEW